MRRKGETPSPRAGKMPATLRASQPQPYDDDYYSATLVAMRSPTSEVEKPILPAAGVVMDMGGVLSHGAIIAREYGLPAVVNVGPASQIIQTGQTIRVDGDRGTVTILNGT